jgi:hypothetical protein
MLPGCGVSPQNNLSFDPFLEEEPAPSHPKQQTCRGGSGDGWPIRLSIIGFSHSFKEKRARGWVNFRNFRQLYLYMFLDLTVN